MSSDEFYLTPAAAVRPGSPERRDITAGSLVHSKTSDPLALLYSRPAQVSRRIAADMVWHVLAYVPLGFVAYAAVKRRRAWPAAGAAFGLAMLVSAGIEMAQWFTPYRDCNLLDVVMNMAGTALGIG